MANGRLQRTRDGAKSGEAPRAVPGPAARSRLRLSPAERLLREESEEDFLAWVIDRAHASRWLVMHPRPARTATGWRTPVQGDGAGWPDLVLVRDRILYAELKRVRGDLSPDQQLWRDALIAAGADWHLWRPTDRDLITRELQ